MADIIERYWFEAGVGAGQDVADAGAAGDRIIKEMRNNHGPG